MLLVSLVGMRGDGNHLTKWSVYEDIANINAKIHDDAEIPKNAASILI